MFLIQSTTFYDLTVSRYLFSKTEKRQFSASGTDGSIKTSLFVHNYQFFIFFPFSRFFQNSREFSIFPWEISKYLGTLGMGMRIPTISTSFNKFYPDFSYFHLAGCKL